MATEHARTRVQFGRKLQTFQGIQEKIARMTIAHYVCEVVMGSYGGGMS